MSSSITVGGQTYTLIPLPTAPGPSEFELGSFDGVAFNPSPYTLQAETQSWPGLDRFDAKITLPPMTAAVAAAWRAFLAELRGQLNVFQIVDPSAPAHPLGNTSGSVPVVDTADYTNLPMTTTLGTRGWAASHARVLCRGDRLQIGYRYYMVCEDASSDSSGKAALQVWPSLRETPADATAITLASPQMLLRLASGRRAIQWSPGRLTTLSFAAIEVK